MEKEIRMIPDDIKALSNRAVKVREDAVKGLVELERLEAELEALKRR